MKQSLPRRTVSGFAFLLGIGLLGAGCSGTPPGLASATPTPNPHLVPPIGAQLSPYAAERIVLDTLPFPANTLAIETIKSDYDGQGTWNVQATLGERIRPSLKAPEPRQAVEQFTRFIWTVSDRDRAVIGLNPEGQRWMDQHWYPGP